jgi:hypothetical protein
VRWFRVDLGLATAALGFAAELSPMTEVEVVDQETPVEMEVHVVAAKGLLACFRLSCLPLLIALDLTFGYAGVRDDVTIGVGFHQMMQGEPSSGFGDDDDEQIVQCLAHLWIS